MMDEQQSSPQKRDNHTPSCAVCQRRKVKCDRTWPCAACTKSGLECSFPPPRPGKKAKRNATHQHSAQDSRARRTSSQHSISAQRNNSVSHGFPSPDSTHSTGTNGGTARLISEGSGYRYVNNHLYSALEPEDQIQIGSPGTHNGSPVGHAIYEDAVRSGHEASQSFLFGNAYSIPSPIETPVVPADHIIFLWETYLANVDPVMKISHAPTVQKIFTRQIGKPNIPRNEKALISAVYFISVVSLTDQTCWHSLQEPRMALLQRFRAAAEQALSAASFITTTDEMTLQALILYLAALRSLGELQMVWSLFGVAIRIAGTIGLPRDGTSFGLSAFDTEMRRRLWWGIVYFDGRMAELLGQDGDLMGNDYEAGPPSNLNDSDLFPSMLRLPEPRKGPTEAIYLQARILSVTVARSLQSLTGPQGTWHRLRDANMTTVEKLEVMQSIEQRYNEEILDCCDPTVPLQWLSINTARTFATKLRLIARIPKVDLDRPWEDEDGFSENEFILSMELVQLQVDLWCEPMVRHWRWHWQAHFQWYALVCLLRQTRLRQEGHEISQAWTLIQKAFQIIIPSLELGPRKSVLLDGIHTLLNAAKRHTEHAGVMMDGGEVKPLTIDGVPMSPSKFVPLNGFSNGFGSRPHSALLPGMDSHSQLPTPTSFGHCHIDEMGDTLPQGIDLEGFDWVEFERLASELASKS